MGGRNIHKIRLNGQNNDDGFGKEGYMATKIRKLNGQFDKDSSKCDQISTLFKGIAIHVNGYTDPSKDELKLIMARHGGKFHMYYSRQHTTHIIATNLPRAKIKDLRQDQNVVSPKWIMDSLEHKTIQPLTDYRVHFATLTNQPSVKTMLNTNRNQDIQTIHTSHDVNESVASTSKSMAETKAIADASTSSIQSDDSKFETNTDISPDQKRFGGTGGIAATDDNNFLSEFYSHSRLHFLSTFKNKLTDFVRNLQHENKSLESLDGFISLNNLAKDHPEYLIKSEHSGNEKYLMHIDMDCFFASVALLKNPHLEGEAIAVTHSSGSNRGTNRPGVDLNYEKQYYESLLNKASNPNTSVKRKFENIESDEVFSAAEIACVNYEARKYGLRNGMFFGKAKEMCPNLRTVPYDFDSYKKVSLELYSVLSSFTHVIEAVSCDEAFMDITEIVRKTKLKPSVVASEIRQKVKLKTGCNCSAGIGPSIVLARMSTKIGKPNGQHEVTLSQASDFMADKFVKDLPGVGRSTAHHLEQLGVNVCGDLQQMSLQKLKNEFGLKAGEKLKDLSFGKDDRQITRVKDRKSVSADVNYGIRLANVEKAKTFFYNLSREVTKRLMEANCGGRKITLKVKVRREDAPVESVKFGGHGVCNSFSKSANLPIGVVFTDSTAVENAIYTESWKLLKSLHLENDVTQLRGIGIQITQLSSLTKKSPSATFMKKFIEKKNCKAITAAAQTNSTASAETPSTSHQEEDIDSAINKQSTDRKNNITETKDVETPTDAHELEQVKTEEDTNTSFLNALPEDIRKEVEENLHRQKNFLQQMEVDVTIPTKKTATQNTKVKRSGKVKQATLKGVSKRKRTNKLKTVTLKTSPNKLITDMFPVTYSPKKNVLKASMKKSILKNSKRSLIMDENLNEDYGKPIVIDSSSCDSFLSVEEQPKIVAVDIPAVTTTQPSLPNTHNNDTKENNCNNEVHLGGATTIQEVRNLISSWVEAYAEEGPLQNDTDDILRYLVDVAIKARDLHKSYLVIRYLQRVVKNAIIRNNRCHIESPWVKSYYYIINNYQKEISKNYKGRELKLDPLF